MVAFAVAVELVLILGVLGISLGSGDGARSGGAPDRPPAPAADSVMLEPEPGYP
jgi:hypothetical protein